MTITFTVGDQHNHYPTCSHANEHLSIPVRNFLKRSQSIPNHRKQRAPLIHVLVWKPIHISVQEFTKSEAHSFNNSSRCGSSRLTVIIRLVIQRSALGREVLQLAKDLIANLIDHSPQIVKMRQTQINQGHLMSQSISHSIFGES
ncbi:hypothetical protein D2T81_18065 [Azospirillum brasilense]|nr:hypothetical protein D2T81_18065 [Azospirillum brasilense]